MSGIVKWGEEIGLFFGRDVEFVADDFGDVHVFIGKVAKEIRGIE